VLPVKRSARGPAEETRRLTAVRTCSTTDGLSTDLLPLTARANSRVLPPGPTWKTARPARSAVPRRTSR
jgi:hypothetical protein